MMRIAFSFLLAAMALLTVARAADEKPDQPDKAAPATAAQPDKPATPAPGTPPTTDTPATPAFKPAQAAPAEPPNTAAEPAKNEPAANPATPTVGKDEKGAKADKGGGSGKAEETGHRVLRLTLAKAIRFALAKNFQLRAERFGPRIAQENVRSAFGKFDPVLDVTYLHGDETTRSQLARDAVTNDVVRQGIGVAADDDTVSVGVSGVTTWGMTYDVGLTARRSNSGLATDVGDLFSHEVSLNLTQPLLRGAGRDVNLAGVHTAQNNVHISDWALKDRIITVITDVIVVYNDLHFTKENLKVALESRALAQQLLSDNIKKEKAGVMVELDVTEAQSGVATREEAVIQADRDVKDQENFLKQLITDDLIPLLGTDVEIVPPSAPDFYANVVAGVKEALDLRPDYREAKLNIENQKITVKVQKNALLPRLDLTASLGLLGLSDEFGNSIGRLTNRDQSNWSAGAVFSYPLGNRDALGKYNAATLQAAQLLVQLDQLEQNIVVLVDNANGAVVTARKRIDATTEATRLANKSMVAAQKKYDAGVLTIFEVLQLQEQLSEAKTAELRAKADYNQAIARYQQQIGVTLRTHQVSALGEQAEAKDTKPVRRKK